MGELESRLLKQILAEQQKNNDIMQQILDELKKGDQYGRTITESSDVSEGEGTIRRKRGPKRNI